jgi:hypothetical protein
MDNATNTAVPPAIYNMRPSTVLELLDKSFRIYRDNFIAYVGLTALVIVPVTIISYLSSAWYTGRLEQLGLSLESPRSFSGNSQFAQQYFSQALSVLGALLALGAVAAFIQAVFINGPLTFMASERSLGRRASITESFKAIRGRLLPLAGGLLLFYIIIASLGVGMSFVLFLCGLGLPLLAYIGIVLYAFLTPVLILERVGVMQGLSRAWTLARARFWQVIGVITFIIVIRTFFYVTLQTGATLLSQGTVGLASFGTATALSIIMQALIDVFLAPILPLAMTLLYEDSRIRLEGLDIALQAVDSAQPRISDIASPPGEGLLNRQDMTNIVIFTVGTLALLVVFYGAIFVLAQGLVGAAGF